MDTNIIVACSVDGIIGEKGSSKLLWKQKADMAFFKEKTTNQIVVMGNNTFKSMGSKPLKNRINVVVTREPVEVDITLDKELFYVNDLRCIDKLKEVFNRDVYIIGGESIYDLALQTVDIDNIYQTVIDAVLENICENPAYFNYPLSRYAIKDKVKNGIPDEDNEYGYEILLLQPSDELLKLFDKCIVEEMHRFKIGLLKHIEKTEINTIKFHHIDRILLDCGFTSDEILKWLHWHNQGHNVMGCIPFDMSECLGVGMFNSNESTIEIQKLLVEEFKDVVNLRIQL